MRALLNFVGLCSAVAVLWGVISSAATVWESSFPRALATTTYLNDVSARSWDKEYVHVISEEISGH